MSDPQPSPSFDETGGSLSPLDDYSELPRQADPTVEPVLIGVPRDNLGLDLENELDDDYEILDDPEDELDDDEDPLDR